MNYRKLECKMCTTKASTLMCGISSVQSRPPVFWVGMSTRALFLRTVKHSGLWEDCRSFRFVLPVAQQGGQGNMKGSVFDRLIVRL